MCSHKKFLLDYLLFAALSTALTSDPTPHYQTASPYRTNPEETKEIERHIQELLSKGHIRESLSPCAVTVILVPKADNTLRLCMDCRPSTPLR